MVTHTNAINSSPKLSPRPLQTGETRSPVSIGITDGSSSINSTDTCPNPLTPLGPNRSNATENSLPFDSSASNTSVTNSTIKRKSSQDDDPEPSLGSRLGSDATYAMMISTIFQRFLVRMPHTFIAMTVVFVPLYYGLEKESLAISAATFVGVGGTVYCFVRAFFIETIPEWMLERKNDNKKWRVLMNVTYTGFITVMFTSAVWKLPDLSAAQGLAFLTASFGFPYPFLAKYYGDIDRMPSSCERKYGIRF